MKIENRSNPVTKATESVIKMCPNSTRKFYQTLKKQIFLISHKLLQKKEEKYIYFIMRKYYSLLKPKSYVNYIQTESNNGKKGQTRVDLIFETQIWFKY